MEKTEDKPLKKSVSTRLTAGIKITVVPPPTNCNSSFSPVDGKLLYGQPAQRVSKSQKTELPF